MVSSDPKKPTVQSNLQFRCIDRKRLPSREATLVTKEREELRAPVVTYLSESFPRGAGSRFWLDSPYEPRQRAS